MIELSVDAFPSVKPLLGELRHCIPLNGVLDGRHAGRIFVDDAGAPSTAYVWTPWGYHYLLGYPQDQAFIPALRTKLADELQPQSAFLGEPDILLTIVPDTWESVLDKILPAPPVIKIYRSTFAFNKRKFMTIPDWSYHIPPGYSLERIDEHQAALLVDDICATWRSVDEFLVRGFGYCLLDGSDVVSVCLSAFITHGEVEIGVSTEKAFRRRGYASLTAAAMIAHCTDNGFSPHWECFWDNEPSIRLARKLGFEDRGDMPIHYWQGAPAT